MKCPRLADLPAPPAGRDGWPWTEESQVLDTGAAPGDGWPTIGIVTTNHNYGRFLEETIRSVLLQGYPNLEYVVIDAGSTDGSVGILRQYERWLSFWVSERDAGQAQGINKGIARSRGEIFNWLNSDDQLLPGALAEVGRAWRLHRPDWLVGGSLTVDALSRRVLRRWQPRAPRSVLDFIRRSQEGLGVAQPSAFLRLSFVRETGGLREDLQYLFDWALYLRLLCAQRGRLKTAVVPAILSACLSHPEAKMIREPSLWTEEGRRLSQEGLPALRPAERSLLRRQVEWNDVLDRVGRSGPGGRGDVPRLLWLLARHPALGLSRFFWGALRRAMRDAS